MKTKLDFPVRLAVKMLNLWPHYAKKEVKKCGPVLCITFFMGKWWGWKGLLWFADVTLHSVCRESLPGAVKAGTLLCSPLGSTASGAEAQWDTPQKAGLEHATPRALATERPTNNVAPENCRCQSLLNVSNVKCAIVRISRFNKALRPGSAPRDSCRSMC